MSDIHTLTITAHPEDPTDSDLFTYDIRCPEITEACRLWVECEIGDCAARGGNVVHDVPHQDIGGNLCVPTDACYLIEADEMPDAASHLARKGDLGAGEYQVGHNFDEGMIADLHLIEDAVACDA